MYGEDTDVGSKDSQGERGVDVVLNPAEGGRSLRRQRKREAIHSNMKRVNV